MTLTESKSASSPAPVSARARVLLWALGFLLLAGFVGWQLPWLERVHFAQGVTLRAARMGRQVSPAQPLPIELSLRAEVPLAADLFVLIHWSGSPLSCNGYAHSTLDTTAARTRSAVELTHRLTLPAPDGCAPGALALFATVYQKGQSLPLRVLSPTVEHERVLLGTSELVERARSVELRNRSGRALARGALFAPLLPWWPGLLALCAVLGFVFIVRGQPLTLATPLWSVESRARVWSLRALPAVVLLIGLAAVLEFFKDDAFISFRYARNLVRGEGLVFNPGERVEGITNFLWTLMLVPFEALGCDLLQVTEWLGAGCALACLGYLVALGGLLRDDVRPGLIASWPALWLASSSSFVLYAHSGLEPPLAALLLCAGAYTLYRARDAGAGAAGGERGYLRAGLLLSAGCLTRPELHLAVLLLALPLWADIVRTRRVARAELRFLLGVAALTVPAHLFRYLYYGSLLPNTFYVKTSADPAVWRLGLDTLRDLFSFNRTGLLLLLAPLSLLDRRRTLEKLAALALSLAFLVYYARVGVDEMVWHRLYLPALPFAALLAASGADNLARWCAARVSPDDVGQRVFAAIVTFALALWVVENVGVTHEAWKGFDGRRGFAGSQYMDLARFLTRHERPGGLVAFQDMGGIPYHAPDLRFLDFVGLVDREVARARHAHGLHAHVNVDSPAQRAFDAEMRAYFHRREPAWTILTVYVEPGRAAEVERAFAQDLTGASLAPYFAANPLHFALSGDASFLQRYVPVRTLRRSQFYYLVLCRRRDLWLRTPRELVFDAPPPSHARTVSTFAEGLEFLGAELTQQARTQHEVHVTSWWRLPGPRARDLTFRLRFQRQGAQHAVSFDHVPGDWLYPATRWKQGEILEDRTLVALTAQLSPGLYQVSLSVYRRSSGQALEVLTGRDAGRDRVALGSLRVVARRPLLDPLIPRTDVTRERAHPQRISSSR